MFNIFDENVNRTENVIAKYFLQSKTSLKQAAWELAIGQSVGNPNVRNKWETDELFEKYSCKILHTELELENQTEGIVYIAFPIINTDWNEDAMSHLLCQLMGGQMDIDNVLQCHLLHLQFPDQLLKHFYKPRQGITGAKEYTTTVNKPLLGGIVKPKTGISPEVLLEMVIRYKVTQTTLKLVQIEQVSHFQNN